MPNHEQSLSGGNTIGMENQPVFVDLAYDRELIWWALRKKE